jgi:hypothetical protein
LDLWSVSSASICAGRALHMPKAVLYYYFSTTGALSLTSWRDYELDGGYKFYDD